MNRSSHLKLFAPLLLLSGSALAQVPVDQIRLGTPTYAGTGCPLGTVSAQLSPDAQSLSILFGGFQAEAGGFSGKTVDRKACNIAIPVAVPGGYSVSVIKIDYRGYNRLPLNASSSFEVEYFFAGQNGPAYRKNFVGATDGNFTLNNTLMATANVWSPCGEDVNLRTNTSIAVQTNGMNEQAMMTLDSADISSGVVYQLQWRSCGGVGGYPTGGGGYPGGNGGGGYPGGNGNNGGGYPYPGQLGPCMINSYYDQRGFQVFMVKDGTGRILGNTVQYAEALRIAEQSQQMGFCQGIVNNVNQSGNNGGYPGNNGGYPGNGGGYPGNGGGYPGNGGGYPGNGGGYPGNGGGYPGNGGGYPGNGGYVGRCQIMRGGNAMGQRFFRVIDRSGRILFNTPDYNQAVRFAQQSPACY